MNPEVFRAILSLGGGIVGGLVLLGGKSIVERRKVRVTASLVIAGGGGKIPHYSFKISIVNTGGKTVHIVRYGIWGTCKLNAAQREQKDAIQRQRRELLGLRRFIRRETDYGPPGSYHFNETLVLAPS